MQSAWTPELGLLRRQAGGSVGGCKFIVNLSPDRWKASSRTSAATFLLGPTCAIRPISQHTSRSYVACIIFAKLWQFDAANGTRVLIHTNKIDA